MRRAHAKPLLTRLSFQFAGLWKYIQDWQGVFRHFDADRSGSIDQGELARALSSFGYNLNPRLLQTVVQKFGECMTHFSYSTQLRRKTFCLPCISDPRRLAHSQPIWYSKSPGLHHV